MVLRLRVPAPGNWRGAKCHIITPGPDYDPWFPDEELPADERVQQETEALEFCNGTADGVVCSIRHECLIFALTNNEKTGIWGGTNRPTRKLIRRQWPLRRGKEPRPEWRWMTHEEALALHDPVPQSEGG